MGLFDRMRTILSAKANTILDQAENPRETLDYSYEKLVELLQKVQRGIVDEVTAKHRLAQQARTWRRSWPRSSKLPSPSNWVRADDRPHRGGGTISSAGQ